LLACELGLAGEPALRSSAWTNGPSRDPGFFPIAVWLQSPANATRFKAAGINTYIGLWNGPTEPQLASLKEAGLQVICEQNAVGLAHRDDPTIVAWMHGDEPDNAQSLGRDKGYGPPILPERIREDYQKMRQLDPTRPTVLNLGQGVAWDNYIGRGVRRSHPEDYAQYAQGGDIVSFDIYPAVHSDAEVAGKLEFVARGVERLREWAGPSKTVWNCIECTHIGNPKTKPTPAQVRAEVWMSLIHGSRGLIYFVHQFEPRFVEAALLQDAEMLAAVTEINRQVRELAPVINAGANVVVSVSTDGPGAPVACMARQCQSETFLFAVGMRGESVRARFRFASAAVPMDWEVLGESRRIQAVDGVIEDGFKSYAVHLYRSVAKR